ncbi:MAG: transglutaminase domain-containing protein [bacterium]|nr:transglutaminase domain-containing protein [bacterium]
MKKLALIAALILSISVFTVHASAASDFTESDTVKYTINEDGSTHVTQNIRITNLTAEYYTNKYTLGVGSAKISNLKAYDKAKSIKADFKQEASTSAINLNFADQVIGKNTTRNFTIEYDSESITQKLGTSWSISIPKISSNGLKEYIVTVSVPASFGAASTIFPKPASAEEAGIHTNYTFSTEQMIMSGITMNFGDKQVYTMGLTYHLSNSQRNSVYTEIALPMNTPFQTVVYESILPKPQSVIADEDGNYIAKYILKPKETIQVQVIAKAIVYLSRQNKEVLSDTQRKVLTQKQPYWDVDDPQIASLAATLKTPENIYRYVVDTLTYNSSKTNTNIDRVGAKGILSSPENSVCMEFTDLFIALARAAGIPTREINGYAYTNDSKLRPASLSQDTLHAWPEYYDEQKGWIPVDPTWENTTNGVDYFNSFDLNHIAFVRKGQSSETPYPAGAYRGEDLDTRDIVVNFIGDEPDLKKQVDTSIELSKSHLAGTPLSWKINLINSGNTGVSELITEETNYKGSRTSEQIFVIIPPFGSKTIIRKGIKTAIRDDASLLISVNALNHSTTKDSEVLPFYKHSVTLIGILYLLGVPVISLFSYKILHKKK